LKQKKAINIKYYEFEYGFANGYNKVKANADDKTLVTLKAIDEAI
jgi:hypothetical protein